MVHNEIHTIDLLIIAAYLIAMVLIGLVVVRKVRNMDDYYLGGRSFGPLVLMATVCATIIGGSGLMGRAGVAYSSGFKAIMTALPYLLGMFIFSGFAGRISAVGTTFGVSSIPDLFEQRFGKSAKVTLGALIAFTMMGTVASQVTATATIINMLGNEIGAASKNVVGIAAGFLDGLSLSSLKGALMSRGTHEIAELIGALGGNPFSAYGLCHLGDYEATVFSAYSHNRRFGEAFVRGSPIMSLRRAMRLHALL